MWGLVQPEKADWGLPSGERSSVSPSPNQGGVSVPMQENQVHLTAGPQRGEAGNVEGAVL